MEARGRSLNGDRADDKSESDETYYLGTREVGEHGRWLVPTVEDGKLVYVEEAE
jgi:hypothetical protein